MKNTFKLLLAGIIGGLTAFFIYQGILVFMNHKNIIKTQETTHEIRVGENISIPDIIEKYSPAVIQIINMKKNNNEININNIGSGVIIDNNNGYAVTNYHIVNNEGDLIINLSDGRTTKGKRLGCDPNSDISVIQIEDKNKLKALPIGDSSKLKIGQIAIAIGSPIWSELRNTSSLGIISALNRKISIEGSNNKFLLNLIQTDAIINSLNTGGALINSSGELIGINTIKINEPGIEGFGSAIPSNIVKKIADDIIKNGKINRTQLGISKLIEINKNIANYYNLISGIYIGEVLENSAALKAGIENKDILFKIENKNINTIEQLKQTLYSYLPGDSVNIKIFRNNKQITLNLILQ